MTYTGFPSRDITRLSKICAVVAASSLLFSATRLESGALAPLGGASNAAVALGDAIEFQALGDIAIADELGKSGEPGHAPFLLAACRSDRDSTHKSLRRRAQIQE